AKVGHPGWPDEPLEVQSVNAGAIPDEVTGRVHVRPRVRAKAELAQVHAILAERHRRSDPNRRVAPIDRHRVAERDADVDDRHVEARPWRRISATLQAWAMQPTGRKGGSGSKISLMVPSPASARCCWNRWSSRRTASRSPWTRRCASR